MNYRFFPVIISILFTSSALGSPPPASLTYNDQRQQALKIQKGQTDADTRQRLKKRADARVLQERAQYAVEATTVVDHLLQKLPLTVKEHPASTVAVVINKLAFGISLGVRAIGRWREAAQQVLSTNEQVLEAAVKSYERIESLSATLKDMLGPKTVIDAFKELPSSRKSTADKVLDLFRPQNYLNTFTKFTDATYISNKADRWEQVKKTSELLIDEEKRFDDYIAMLQIKILERQIMNLHKLENFTAAKNGSKTSSNPQTPGYKAKLEERITIVKAAIDATDKKIRALSGIKNPTGGLTNRLKKVVGKDDESQRVKEIAKLNAEKAQYVKQMSEVQAELDALSTTSLSPDEIKDERELLRSMIEEVKGRRMPVQTLDDVNDTLRDIQKQINSIQEQITALKATSGALPQAPTRPATRKPPVPQRTQ